MKFPRRLARKTSSADGERWSQDSTPITGSEGSVIHAENSPTPKDSRWKISKVGGGDTAMALFDSPEDVHEPYGEIQERKLFRKVDYLILPYIAVCYAFFYIDKTPLSYAAIVGIQEDSNLQGTQYSWLSSIFYLGFLAWVLPTNYTMQQLPFAKILGINIFLWRVLFMAQAASRNFTTLAVLRALSGAAEASSDPSFILVTSMLCTRREQPVRIGTWYIANGCGIALGGLLGYGIGQIRGSFRSWKYSPLIMGAMSFSSNMVLFLLLPDSPVTARMLSSREKRIAVERLPDSQTGVENNQFKGYQVIEAFTDIKLYMFFFIGFVGNVPNAGISKFGTLIINSFGCSTLATTLLQILYGVLIVISILTCVYLNDALCTHYGYQSRCYFILLFLLPNIAGAFGLRFVPQDQQVGRLICYYLTGPYNAAFVLVLSLATANVAGHTKKVIVNAALFLGYGTGNIAGPFFYKRSQAPVYQLGIWSMIVAHLLEAAAVVLLRVLLARENAKRERMQGERGNLNKTAFGDLTDKENLSFRYIY